MADVEKIAAELRALVDPMAEAMPDGVRLTGLIQVGRALLDELDRLRTALSEIAASDDIENALDPARNKRIAARALFTQVEERE